MVDSGDDGSNQPTDAPDDSVDVAVSATPPQKRRRLGTQREIKRERIFVYFECREGRMSWSDGDYASRQLDRHRKAEVDVELERRVAALEQKQSEKP